MIERDRRSEPFARGVTGNEFVVYRLDDRRMARWALKAYAAYTRDTPTDITFTRRSPRLDRIMLSVEGEDLQHGINVVGFLGVVAGRGSRSPAPTLETLYISPHLETYWQNRVGGMLFANSQPINRSGERQVMISDCLDINRTASQYLSTHGFEPCPYSGRDHRDEEYVENPDRLDHFRQQSKENLLRHIDADLKPRNT